MPNIFDERLVPDEAIKNHIIYDEHLIRYILAKEFSGGKTVLDIASGSGYGAKILASAGAKKVFAVDIDKEAVRKAKEKYRESNLEYIVADAEETGFEDKKFDVIASFETIEHLKDQEKFLAELKRILHDNGILIISTPNREVFGNKNPFHTREFTKEEFERVLKKYFQYSYIFGQSNCLASCIKLSESEDAVAFTGSKEKVLYFIAFCSSREIREELPKENYLSLNNSALENMSNNPGLKIANKVYSLLIKIPGAKKFFDIIKN